MGERRARPCVLRRAPFGRLLRMRLNRVSHRLILSKRSASKDGRATGEAVRPSTRSLRSLAQDEAEPRSLRTAGGASVDLVVEPFGDQAAELGVGGEAPAVALAAGAAEVEHVEMVGDLGAL